MLVNMFVGRPPGNYDRLLDFSRAVTGSLFFVPSATFLENVATSDKASPRADPSSHGGKADDAINPKKAAVRRFARYWFAEKRGRT